MVRKRLYAKRTASAEYEQLDLFGLLEEEQRQAVGERQDPGVRRERRPDLA